MDALFERASVRRFMEEDVDDQAVEMLLREAMLRLRQATSGRGSYMWCTMETGEEGWRHLPSPGLQVRLR